MTTGPTGDSAIPCPLPGPNVHLLYSKGPGPERIPALLYPLHPMTGVHWRLVPRNQGSSGHWAWPLVQMLLNAWFSSAPGPIPVYCLGIKSCEPDHLGSNPPPMLIRVLSVGTLLCPSVPPVSFSLSNQDDFHLVLEDGL